MKTLLPAFAVLTLMNHAQAQVVKHDIPYATPAQERQVLDVYSPANAKNLPVVFWIHGGGWEGGDKSSVKLKPQAFMDRGFVFVSTNYRLLPKVDMETIVADVAKSIGWVHKHIAEYGGDPNRIFVMGHSAGAQLAARAETPTHTTRTPHTHTLDATTHMKNGPPCPRPRAQKSTTSA